jgi:hypothetical protein
MNVSFTFVIFKIFPCFLLVAMICIHGLKIKITPNKDLLELTLFNSEKTLFPLFTTIFSEEDFWPLLKAFASKSNGFNFDSVLRNILRRNDCSVVQRIITSEHFPAREVVSSDLIVSDEKLVKCFSSFDSSFFKDKLKDSPLTSLKYVPTKWSKRQHTYLLYLAMLRKSLKTNWHSWCADPNLSLDYILDSSEFWKEKLWKTVSYFCIKDFPETLAERMVEYFDPLSDLDDFNAIRPSSIKTRISHFFHRIVHSEVNTSDLKFSIGQILKVFALIVCKIKLPSNVEVSEFVYHTLQDYLNQIKTTHRKKFPMRRELKQFIREFISFRFDAERYERSERISVLLLKLVEFCMPEINGPGLLNAFVIWEYFRSDISISINSFSESFFGIFFHPDVFVTGPDVCALFKFIKSSLSTNSEYESILRYIDMYLYARRDLAIEVLQCCPNEIPEKIISISFFFL